MRILESEILDDETIERIIWYLLLSNDNEIRITCPSVADSKYLFKRVTNRISEFPLLPFCDKYFKLKEVEIKYETK